MYAFGGSFREQASAIGQAVIVVAVATLEGEPPPDVGLAEFSATSTGGVAAFVVPRGSTLDGVELRLADSIRAAEADGTSTAGGYTLVDSPTVTVVGTGSLEASGS